MSRELHGESKARLYRIWRGIRDRCYNKNVNTYIHYGAKGVQVCKEWRDSYIVFREWANANGYEENLSIDRISYTGNYTPSNCRWTSKAVQARNTGMRHSNSSGFKGVGFHKKAGRYIARIMVDCKNNHIGLYDTAIEAARAYDKYILDHNLEHTTNNELGRFTA